MFLDLSIEIYNRKFINTLFDENAYHMVYLYRNVPFKTIYASISSEILCAGETTKDPDDTVTRFNLVLVHRKKVAYVLVSFPC